MKILVIASEPFAASDLRAAVGSDATEEAEVLVIAPALHESPIRFWLSDADAAIAKANCVQSASVEHLSAAGVTATGDTGESDPLTAITDSLTEFPAERIVVFSHPAREEAYHEAVSVAEIEARFGLPTSQHQLAR